MEGGERITFLCVVGHGEGHGEGQGKYSRGGRVVVLVT